MRQRLALAGALLGDPETLVLDEPSNGLDPEGMRWLRGFLRRLADEGRTVLVSSHVLSEVEQTVDDVVIIADGRHFLHRFHVDQPRATLAVDHPQLARPLVMRFEQIWATGEPGLGASVLGL